MKFIYSLMLLPFLIGCKPNNKNHSDPDTVIIPAKPNKFGVQEDCYKDRTTVKIVGNRSARVLQDGQPPILDCYELGERYQPCELPEWAIKGTEVMISGITKSVREDEKREGTPFVISEISKK